MQKVFARPAPTAIAGVDRTVAKVNQPRTFDGHFSETTFPDTTYRWDFGDGVTAFGSVVTHVYERPGTYIAVLTVANGPLTSRATLRVIVVPDEPLVADAGDDRVGEEQLPLSLDGGGSRPFAAIESFAWDFGDGTPSRPRTQRAAHLRRAGYVHGDADDHLRDRDGDRHRCRRRARPGLWRRQRWPASHGARWQWRGRPRRRCGRDRRRRRRATPPAPTTPAWRACKQLPDGRFSVYAYKLGYQPAIGRARVVGGLGTASVTLTPGQVGSATLEHRRLTLDEIIAAGIDVNDPANQNVLEFNIELGFEVFSDEEPSGVQLRRVHQRRRRVLRHPDRLGLQRRPHAVRVRGRRRRRSRSRRKRSTTKPVLVFLIIPVKASWLKEFFEVTMVVANLAPKGFGFSHGAATVDLPAGLTLAPTALPQDLTMSTRRHPSGKSGIARWIVRGDRSGSYDFGAAYTRRARTGRFAGAAAGARPRRR